MLSSINREKYPLFVLSASAGSGKTYQLVLQYLSVLLDSNLPSKYKGIVAITFTNKASLEMKSRIIDALFNLAEYNKGPNKEKTESIINELGNILQIDHEEIRKRSAQALKAILHGYENFNVSTIDKFNLRLIKSFSSDLELPNDFEISLNEDEVLEEVLELLLSSIGENGNKDLTVLVKEYAKSNFREGNQWNFKRQLMSFASSLNKEKNRPFISSLMNMSFDSSEYTAINKKIQKLNSEFRIRIKGFSDLFLQLSINSDDLPYKTTTYNALVKISKMKECPIMDRDEHFLPKRILTYCMDSGDTKALTRELKDKLLAIDSYYLEISQELALLLKYRANFFNMALLRYVLDSLMEHKEKSKIIRISEFNELISNLVKKEDAPYIYERFGVKFEHFLLDEFQDTSRLQWLNLLPLIRESLSYKKENLIVGDPKQSIYRFNNGLAEQFVSLPKVYNPEQDEYISEVSSYFNELGIKKPLQENYRSCPEIVAFNNAVFENLSLKLSSRFKEFYESVRQVPVSKDKGFVRIISEKGKRNVSLMVSEICEIIEQVKDDDFDLGDVCILTDKNALGVQIANELTQKNIPVFTQQSLLISKNIQVRLLLAYMKWRMRPTMDMMKKQFSELFFRMLGDDEDGYFDYIQEKTAKSGKAYRVFDDERFLNEYFNGREHFFRPFENIYEVVIQFITMMKWKETENPFLHQFVDLVFQFQNTKQSDLSKFIEYYEEHKKTFALKMPDSKNAIQIMTLHKAKGLEFPIVIIPEMDFGLSIRNDSKFFVESESKILYTSLSKNSVVEEIYGKSEEERNLILLDKVNLLYVGFTRAERRLYVFNRFYKNTNLGASFHECLVDGFKLKEQDGLIEYVSGETRSKSDDSSLEIEPEDVYYTPDDVSIDLSHVKLVLNDRDDESYESREERLFGNYFHEFMSEVYTVDDIPVVFKKMQSDDQMEGELLQKVLKSAEKFFNTAQRNKFFENATKILNEQSILIPPSKVLRPDKVIERKNDVIVVDFKTGKSTSDHHEQIWNYKSALEEIYDKPVKAVLYYTIQDQLIEL